MFVGGRATAQREETRRLVNDYDALRMIRKPVPIPDQVEDKLFGIMR
jgi:hypothetical protein